MFLLVYHSVTSTPDGCLLTLRHDSQKAAAHDTFPRQDSGGTHPTAMHRLYPQGEATSTTPEQPAASLA